MRLNIGAGNKRIPGYTGVDAVARPAADIVAPAWAIPLEDGVADEIMAIHLIEHMVPWQAEDAIREWARLLKPGGRLVMEQPDIIKCCQNLIDGVKGKHPDQMGLWGIFGDARSKDEFMLHRYGYSFESLRAMVKPLGFSEFREAPTQFHRTGKWNRDFRLEARRA